MENMDWDVRQVRTAQGYKWYIQELVRPYRQFGVYETEQDAIKATHQK